MLSSNHLAPVNVRVKFFTILVHLNCTIIIFAIKFIMEGDKRNYRVLRNEKVGRYVVAGRDLKAGEIIFTELPFVYGPKADTPPLCLGCYSPADGSTVCSKCKWPVCGPECQEISAHRDAECKVFAAAGVQFQPVEDATAPCPQYECITQLRFLLAKDANPERWENEVKVMEAHNDLRRNQPIWNLNQNNIVDFLRGPCKLKDRYDEELIHTVCGIIEVNSFECRSANGYAVRAIYPQLAIISHNCVPNTGHSIMPVDENGKEFRVHIRASTNIKAEQELFVTYTHSLLPTMLRREHLKEGKYFDCECARCADPTELGTYMSTLKCTKCDNGVVMSTNSLDSTATWKCTHCEFSARGETILKVFHTIQAEIDTVEMTAQDSHGIEEREKIFRRYKSVLHPQHAFMTILKHSLSQMYGRMEGYMLEDLPDLLLERKIELCQQLLKIIDVVEPGYSRLRGMTLYELHAPIILLARSYVRSGLIDKKGLREKLEEAVKLLEESAAILKLEPPSSPEGIIGQIADQSLQQLKENMEVLIENA